MARQLTVLQLLPALESGGVERGTLELGAGLVRAGHRSMVISAGGQLVSRLTGQGSEHLEWPLGKKSLWTLRLVRRLRRLILKEKVDILHARSRFPAWIAWRAWRGLPADCTCRFVTTVHGLYSVKRYSSIMTRGERVIAVSDAAKRYLISSYPKMDAGKIVVIERGVDPAVYPYAFRPPDSWLSRWYQDFPFLLERQVLTLPGRITRLKGHLHFLKLLDRLIKAGLPVYGLIVGGVDKAHAAYLDELEVAVKKLGLQDSVTFTGHRMDLRDIMANSNLVFSLSQKPESFGRTVHEALSMGVPVVAYAHGGVGDTLEQVYPEGRVPVGDLDALESVAHRLIEHPESVDAFRFTSVDEMIAQTLDLYQSLTGA